MKQNPQKGVITNVNGNNQLTVSVSPQEIKHFIKCGNHNGKDNILFFDENSTEQEVFLLLHGDNNGNVIFENKKRTLKEVYHYVKQLNIFELFKLTHVKYIQVLCCHSGYIIPYTDKENGITIKPFFTNKGCLLGKQVSSNEYQFITEESLVA